MGIYVNGVLGPFSGKLGNVIGSNWRSIDYMRSRPTHSKDRLVSEKQKEVRSKFALAAEFISPLRDLVNLSYPVKKGSRKSGFDKAMAHVLECIENSGDNLIISYPKIQLSHGSLSPIEGVFSGIEADKVSFNWKPKISIGTAEGNDVVYIVMYDTEGKDYFIFSDAKRSDGRRDLNLNEIGKGTFEVWTFASTHDCARFSNSVYNGALEL